MSLFGGADRERRREREKPGTESASLF